MKTMICLFLLMLFTNTFAQYVVDRSPTPLSEFSADEAFQFSATARDYQTILTRWKIAPGYYLYRDQFHFQIIHRKNERLAQPLFPKGIIKSFSNLGHYEVYKGIVIIPIPVIEPQNKKITLEVNYQGCSEAGFCYPPNTKTISIDLTQPTMQFREGVTQQVATHDKVKQLLMGDNFLALFIGFLGFGLLIAFTPCVLPMIPILSAIITGQKKITSMHAFFLSLSYVLGMAITYAIAGIIVGFVGANLQVAFQMPWIIILFSALFIAMALSLFGFYEIQLPLRWRSKLAKASEHQKHGTYVGVFIMGILSTLILSPCVTPPLVGVLSYIGQTGNAVLGGLALFIMGLGMGLPLLIIGFSHGKLLPKTGAWMNVVRHWMGILMLAMAIWMLQRILSSNMIMLLWATLVIGISLYLGALSSVTTPLGILRKSLGVLLFVYGILLIVSAATGHDNPLKPLPFTQHRIIHNHGFIFKKVNSLSEIEKAITDAHQKNKLLLLDFWAEWCISCKEMDNFTFTNPNVQKRLQNFVLLRVDVTKNTTDDKLLQNHFNVIAPPTLLFFKEGKEIPQARIIGEMDAEAFITHLDQVR